MSSTWLSLSSRSSPLGPSGHAIRNRGRLHGVRHPLDHFAVEHTPFGSEASTTTAVRLHRLVRLSVPSAVSPAFGPSVKSVKSVVKEYPGS